MPDPAASRRPTLVAIGVVLAVYAIVVAGIAWQTRGVLRELFLDREGRAIYSVAQLELDSQGTQLTDLGAADPTGDYFSAVLESSRLREVLSARLFDSTGAQRDALQAAGADTLDAATLTQLGAHQPVVRYYPDVRLSLATGSPVNDDVVTPLLEITVPLDRQGRNEPLWAARYWLNGAPVAAEFLKLDRQLWRLAGVAFGVGGLLLVAVLSWAFGQLNRSHQALQRRSEDLARANRELAFAAKTSALGAISAHLIHDLKNPLAGLAGFVGDEAAATAAAGGDEAWREAVQTTRRLRTMVGDIAALLRDEAGGVFTPLAPSEIGTAAIRRSAEAAEQFGVKLVAEIAADGQPVSGREANLGILVLANLLDNACKASPRGSEVRLSAERAKHRLEFLVTDRGRGLPETVQRELFQPKSGAGAGGSGLGLAISQQLARHAGGLIELARTGPDGTQFRFWLPL